MIRNSKKICRTEGLEVGVAAVARVEVVAASSLMALRLISLQTVDHSRFRATERDPLFGGLFAELAMSIPLVSGIRTWI
jgi:hypothetical protein